MRSINKTKWLKLLEHKFEKQVGALAKMRENTLRYFVDYQSDNALIKKMHEMEGKPIITLIMNVEQEIQREINSNSVAIVDELTL